MTTLQPYKTSLNQRTDIMLQDLYPDRYNRLADCIRRNGFDKAVNNASRYIPFLFFAAMPALLFIQFLRKGPWLLTGSYASAAFLFLSLLRRILNRPRPYETWNISPIIHKDTHGRSFPSRHVFSAFLIASLWVYQSPAFSALLFAAAVILAISRVIGGVHYLSDVIAGAVIGILTGTAAVSFF